MGVQNYFAMLEWKCNLKFQGWMLLHFNYFLYLLSKATQLAAQGSSNRNILFPSQSETYHIEYNKAKYEYQI